MYRNVTDFNNDLVKFKMKYVLGIVCNDRLHLEFYKEGEQVPICIGYDMCWNYNEVMYFRSDIELKVGDFVIVDVSGCDVKYILKEVS